jgi:hypothetical protein
VCEENKRLNCTAAMQPCRHVMHGTLSKITHTVSQLEGPQALCQTQKHSGVYKAIPTGSGKGSEAQGVHKTLTVPPTVDVRARPLCVSRLHPFALRTHNTTHRRTHSRTDYIATTHTAVLTCKIGELLCEPSIREYELAIRQHGSHTQGFATSY